MRLFDSISKLWKDPPPAYAFEISEAGIASARAGIKPELGFQPLKAGVISVSPLRDNILEPDTLAEAVRAIAPPNGKRRDAVLILPDNCARVFVLDFDQFPSDPKEQLSLIRFRVKKSLPFDVESAAISYWPQPGGKRVDVVTVVAPLEVLSRYEAPFRAAGLNPGMVTVSSLASLSLIPGSDGVTVVAKLSGGVLTLMVLEKSILKLVRCLELSEPEIAEIAGDLYPTFVYIEDSLNAKAERLLLCGFGEKTEEAKKQFHEELGVEVDGLRSAIGLAGQNNAGLLGYLVA